ncbi:TIFY 10a-like protein [Drosera capensis]
MATGGSKQVAGSRSSSFSQTCNLLSRYLEEKRSFGDINLGKPAAGTSVHRTTMNLFPQEAGFGGFNEAHAPKAGTNPRMTIFYGGQVFVLNDVPSDKAREIMGLARGSATMPKRGAMAPKVNAADIMPLARKASLHRFFEKRKDRITAKAPYSFAKSVDEPKANNDPGESSSLLLSSSAWLGLAARPAF